MKYKYLKKINKMIMNGNNNNNLKLIVGILMYQKMVNILWLMIFLNYVFLLKKNDIYINK